MHTRSARRFLSVSTVAVAMAITVHSQAPQTIPVPIDEDGTAHLPAQKIPDTSLMSKEGNDSRTYYMRFQQIQPRPAAPSPGRFAIFAPYVKSANAMFAEKLADGKVGGVHVLVYTPKDGVSRTHAHQVLINLHGHGCFLDCGNLESMPIAFYGKIKVIGVDYRETPQNKPQDGIDDVVSVYKELLKSYKPTEIGIFGCSAGGALTAHSLAYFQKIGLPNPAAAGIFCNGGGAPPGPVDASFISAPIGEGHLTDPGFMPGGHSDPDDPVFNPQNSPSTMSKYPPTLLVTGTRAMELSIAVYFHTQLVKAGDETYLEVWEGGRHGFFYDPAVPESKDVATVVVHFFDHYLGKPVANKTPGY